MRKPLKTFVAALTYMIAALLTASAAQGGEWKDTPTPLLKKGEGSGSIHINFPRVLKEDGGYRMWFDGYWGKNDIIAADSKDGSTWTTYSGSSPVLKGDGPELLVAAPCVIKDKNQYSMWYSFNDKWAEGWSFGFATSTDGYRWERFKLNPVFKPSTDGQDDGSLENMCVRVRDGKYYMWYQAHKKGDWKQQIFFATSDDGLTWDRKGVLNYDREFPGLLLSPWVIEEGKTWRMFFIHNSDPQEIGGLHCATSTDGLTWKIDARVPAKQKVASPCVIAEGGKYRMWYASDDAFWYSECDK